MADNPNKKAKDANRVSQQPHEQTYQQQQEKRKEGSEEKGKDAPATSNAPSQQSSSSRYPGNRHNLLL